MPIEPEHRHQQTENIQVLMGFRFSRPISFEVVSPSSLGHKTVGYFVKCNANEGGIMERMLVRTDQSRPLQIILQIFKSSPGQISIQNL